MVVGLPKGGETARDVALGARLDHALAALVVEEVHVAEAHAAKARHLGYGEVGRRAGRRSRDAPLEREHARVEPVLEGEVLGVAAQERHGGVRVGVVEGGHEELAASVVALVVGVGVSGWFGPDIGDAPVADAHVARGQVFEVLVEDADRREQDRGRIAGHGDLQGSGRLRRGKVAATDALQPSGVSS